MCSIKAPTVEDESRNSRAPIDLVAVIDRSSSMGDGKLDLVKTTLEFMILQLKEKDRLALVTFDDGVVRNLDITAMNTEGKEKAIKAAKSLTTGGSTNLSGGLLEGLNIIRNRSTSDRRDVASVLLFTDGQANRGITSKDTIIKAAKGALSQIDGVCTVFSFGFGSDHDPELLKGIAESSNGMFYYIKSQEEIPASFGDCLGGLLSVVAQNIHVKCTPLCGTIKTVHTKFPMVQNGGVVDINLGDIYSEESRDILITMYLPAIKEPVSESPLMEFHIDFFDVIAGVMNSCKAQATITRPGFTDSAVNADITKQYNRVIATEAMERAKEAADKNNFHSATTILNDATSYIQKTSAPNDSFAGILMEDLALTSNAMKDSTSYNGGGKSTVLGNIHMHGHQRSNKANRYENKMKQNMRFQSADWALRSPSAPKVRFEDRYRLHNM